MDGTDGRSLFALSCVVCEYRYGLTPPLDELVGGLVRGMDWCVSGAYYYYYSYCAQSSVFSRQDRQQREHKCVRRQPDERWMPECLRWAYALVTQLHIASLHRNGPHTLASTHKPIPEYIRPSQNARTAPTGNSYGRLVVQGHNCTNNRHLSRPSQMRRRHQTSRAHS